MNSQHFWLFCGLWVGVGGALMWRFPRSRDVILEGESKELVKRFSKAWATAIMIPCVALWLLQLSTDSSGSPDFLIWETPQRWLGLAIQVSIWVWLLWWTFIGSGADQLAKVMEVRSSKNSIVVSSPTGVRIFVVLLVSVSVLSVSYKLV